MPEFTLDELEPGARNLLENCAGALPGDKILLVGEQGEDLYFEPELCRDVALIAESLGMKPTVILAEPVNNAVEFPDIVRREMEIADQIIFFSRLGDQVRFSLDAGNKKTVMTYTLDRSYLASPFASADFRMMKRMHDALLDVVLNAKSYTITAANGTNLHGKIHESGIDAVSEFALELFPVMIFPPVNCYQLNGKLVIDHFVTSSSTNAYEGSTLVMDSPVVVAVTDSRITEFEGPDDLVEKLKAQLIKAAAVTGGDPFLINSWHTGINPNTYYKGDPFDDLELWGTVAYGSPRYTHIHAAGKDPGDAAFHFMDATIAFDDQVLWDEGRFVFLDRPEIQSMMDIDQRALLNSAVRHSIGM